MTAIFMTAPRKHSDSFRWSVEGNESQLAHYFAAFEDFSNRQPAEILQRTHWSLKPSASGDLFSITTPMAGCAALLKAMLAVR